MILDMYNPESVSLELQMGEQEIKKTCSCSIKK